MLLKAPRHGPVFRGSVGVARVVESARVCGIVLLSEITYQYTLIYCIYAMVAA